MLASTRSNPGQNACAPGRCQSALDVLAVQRPPAEVEERRDHDPDRELADVAAHEADRARAARARSRPRRRGSSRTRTPPKPKHVLRERARAGRDHDQLEDRPAEALEDVQRRSAGTSRAARAARAAAPSPARARRRRSARRGRASGCRRSPPRRSRRAPPAARARGRPATAGARGTRPATITSSETERFAQSRKPSKRPEHPQPLGHGLDSPLRCVLHLQPPFAGMTRIRFDGCDLSRSSRHPGGAQVSRGDLRTFDPLDIADQLAIVSSGLTARLRLAVLLPIAAVLTAVTVGCALAAGGAGSARAGGGSEQPRARQAALPQVLRSVPRAAGRPRRRVRERQGPRPGRRPELQQPEGSVQPLDRRGHRAVRRPRAGASSA